MTSPDEELPTVHLTQREYQVLQLVALSNAEISRRLDIKPTTTKRYMESLFEKLEVGNRTQAAIRGIELGLVKPKEP